MTPFAIADAVELEVKITPNSTTVVLYVQKDMKITKEKAFRKKEKEEQMLPLSRTVRITLDTDLILCGKNQLLLANAHDTIIGEMHKPYRLMKPTAW